MPVNPHELPLEPPTSMTMVLIGGREYPLRSVPNCRTCQSPHRRFIENELLAGRSYKAIVRQLADLEDAGRLGHPSAEALSHHVKQGHLPNPVHTRRQIMEKRAEEIGAKIEGSDSIIDHLTVNQMVIQRGFERLVAGEIEPSVSDLMSAIQFQQRVEETSEEGYDAEAYQNALFAYLEIAQKYIPPEVFNRYGRELSRHPIIQAIAGKALGPAQPEVVPGEVTERLPQDE